MKLRIHNGSLRLRLNRTDVDQLQETGICAESLQFGSGSQLTYTLETSSQFYSDGGSVSPGPHPHPPAVGDSPKMDRVRTDLAYPRFRCGWQSQPIDRKGFSLSSLR
jgi:hypothetical protein